MQCEIEGPRGIVMPFRRPGWRVAGLSLSERMMAARWAERARAFGVRAVRIHDPEPGDDPTVEPFILIYRAGEIWAAWGVARRGAGFEVWRPANGGTVGLFDDLAGALDGIATAIGPVGVSLRPAG